MNRHKKRFNYLQRLSQRQLKRADEIRMAREMFYPEPFEEPDVWYKVTVEDHHGKKHTMRLLNREDKRNDSYFVEYQGAKIFFNRFDNLVVNETRWPLILGFSDAMRFMAKQFPRIGSIRRTE